MIEPPAVSQHAWPADMHAAAAPVFRGHALARPMPAAIKERPRGGWGGMPVPHAEQFAQRWNAGRNIYWSRFDEALRDNWQNALAMRRSAFVHELLRHRQLPVVSLPWRIVTDDPKNREQKRIAEVITKLVQAIPRFQALRLYLSEDKWYGKYGSQIAWGQVMVNGRVGVSVVRHEPVDGDSIVFKFDNTPGILVRTGWVPANEYDRKWLEAPERDWIQQADRARALFLYDPFWRDHFIISEFEPSSADFMFEGEKAGAMHGRGLRDRIYWDFQQREEYRGYLSDALQRFGVNGMLYGYYEESNPESEAAVIRALKRLVRDSVTAFPRRKGEAGDAIEHIDPASIAYDVLLKALADIEDTLRRCFLGQTLSGEAQATGLGSKVAELHETTFDHIIRYDATSQADTLTQDLIKPLIRFNTWNYGGEVLQGELPFGVRFVYQIDKANVEERSAVIKTAYDIGLPLDSEKVYEDLGLSPPEDLASAIVKPGTGPMAPAPAPVPGGAPGAAAPGQTQGSAPAPRRSTVRPGFTVFKKPDGSIGIRGKNGAPGGKAAA